jgi:hypothetical protein
MYIKKKRERVPSEKKSIKYLCAVFVIVEKVMLCERRTAENFEHERKINGNARKNENIFWVLQHASIKMENVL